eukprot:GHVU01016657.1.p1 GENE.GHVU01016657.1~~GHVU01016657.1.p1  ORF type:complete len:148 (-),score=5.67 GHVU01016657.1:269-712(-)
MPKPSKRFASAPACDVTSVLTETGDERSHMHPAQLRREYKQMRTRTTVHPAPSCRLHTPRLGPAQSQARRCRRHCTLTSFVHSRRNLLIISWARSRLRNLTQLVGLAPLAALAASAGRAHAATERRTMILFRFDSQVELVWRESMGE